jgi:hypothetical protein
MGKPPIQPSTNGLGGTANIAAAAPSVIDRSYASSALTTPSSAPLAPDVAFHTDYLLGKNKKLITDPKKPVPTLGLYLAEVSETLPDNVAGIAFEQRSYHGGPHYSSPQVTFGSFQTGLDFSYQHFEGGLNGDGLGLRYILDGRDNPYFRQEIAIANDVSTIRRTVRAWRSANPDVKGDPLQQSLIDWMEGDDKEYPDLNPKLRQEFAKLANLMGSDDSDPDNQPTTSRYYGLANLKRAVAVIAGYTNVSGATISNIGLSASQLYPLARKVEYVKHGVSGVGWLLSVQQEFVSVGPPINSSVAQCGLSVVWQDRVATPERAKDRWQALIGAEYLFRTALDQSATYDLFVRYRPCYRGKPVGYIPLDFTVFGGIGPTGYGFIGAKMGFGFSL